jgi:hypothetical protein
MEYQISHMISFASLGSCIGLLILCSAESEIKLEILRRAYKFCLGLSMNIDIRIQALCLKNHPWLIISFVAEMPPRLDLQKNGEL